MYKRQTHNHVVGILGPHNQRTRPWCHEVVEIPNRDSIRSLDVITSFAASNYVFDIFFSLLLSRCQEPVSYTHLLHGVHIAQKSVSQEFAPVAMQKIQCYDGCTRSERNLQFGQIAKNMQNVKRDSNNHPCNFWKVEGCFGLFIIATFIGFTALVAFISWLKTKNDKLDTQDGYFLAGRGLSGLVIAGSLELTNLSTEQLVGQSGQSYATNMGASCLLYTSRCV